MRDLITRFPAYYLASPEMCDIQQAMQPELAALRDYQEAVAEQLCVETATWGLTAWENALGIPVDTEKPLEFRRSRIRGKLRGRGVTTVAMIQNVAESYSNGEVLVTELPAQYQLEIWFVGTMGIPPNMEDLTWTLREILPAHLAVEYRFRYRTWGDMKPFTWVQLSGHTWKQTSEGALTE